MNYSFFTSRKFAIVISFLSLPMIVIAWCAFTGGASSLKTFSVDGFKELFSNVRLTELGSITLRALVVATVTTIIAYGISYALHFKTPPAFQKVFFIVISLPFLINESVRVFSWQYVLAEDGLLNKIVSSLSGSHTSISNGSNIINVYIVMIIACVPFGIFIYAASFRSIPIIYWKVAKDLKLTKAQTFVKVLFPLSKLSIGLSFIISFFIAFSLSAEINYLGGDSKISIRNLVLSLMSSGRFQAIFSLGLLIIILLLLITFIVRIVTAKTGKTVV